MAIPIDPRGVLVFSKLSQAYFHLTTPTKQNSNLKLNLAKHSLISLLLLFPFFSNVTGLAACLICPERFYCKGAEGDSKTPIPCPRGRYCPAGTGKSPEKCPAGTYNPQVSFINSLGDFINGKIKFQHCLGVIMCIRDFDDAGIIILIPISIAFYCYPPTLQCQNFGHENQVYTLFQI